jgi:hypothetical protein
MPIIDSTHLQRLIEIESHVHYGELPPPGINPFVCIQRNSLVVVSAPHGARTFRNNTTEIWHEEDEYTAGMALLLAEICQTSVIATIWRTEESDPNEHGEGRSTYKRTLRQLVDTANPKLAWLIDLHGASNDSAKMAPTQMADLGIGKRKDYLPNNAKQKLIAFLEKDLGKGVVEREDKSGWDAENENRIAAFAHDALHLSSMQIEMKPSVRVPLRRIDASMYGKAGPYSADENNVIAMLQALVDYIEFLKIPPADTPFSA